MCRGLDSQMRSIVVYGSGRRDPPKVSSRRTVLWSSVGWCTILPSRMHDLVLFLLAVRGMLASDFAGIDRRQCPVAQRLVNSFLAVKSAVTGQPRLGFPDVGVFSQIHLLVLQPFVPDARSTDSVSDTGKPCVRKPGAWYCIWAQSPRCP